MVLADSAIRRLFSIGAVAQMVGCGAQTIRDMEARGEIPAALRVEGLDRRFYDPEDVERIRQVRAVRVGRLASPAAA